MSTISEKLNRIENSMNSIRNTFQLQDSNIEDVASSTSEIYNNLSNEVVNLNEIVQEKDNQIAELNEINETNQTRLNELENGRVFTYNLHYPDGRAVEDGEIMYNLHIYHCDSGEVLLNAEDTTKKRHRITFIPDNTLGHAHFSNIRIVENEDGLSDYNNFDMHFNFEDRDYADNVWLQNLTSPLQINVVDTNTGTTLDDRYYIELCVFDKDGTGWGHGVNCGGTLDLPLGNIRIVVNNVIEVSNWSGIGFYQENEIQTEIIRDTINTITINIPLDRLIEDVEVDISELNNYTYTLAEEFPVNEYIELKAGDVIAFKGYDNVACVNEGLKNFIAEFNSPFDGSLVNSSAETALSASGYSGTEIDYGLRPVMNQYFMHLCPQTETFKTFSDDGVQFLNMYRFNTETNTLSNCTVDPTNRMPDGNLYLAVTKDINMWYVEWENLLSFFGDYPIIYKTTATLKAPSTEGMVSGTINIKNLDGSPNIVYENKLVLQPIGEGETMVITGNDVFNFSIAPGTYNVTVEPVNLDEAPYYGTQITPYELTSDGFNIDLYVREYVNVDIINNLDTVNIESIKFARDINGGTTVLYSMSNNSDTYQRVYFLVLTGDEGDVEIGSETFDPGMGMSSSITDNESYRISTANTIKIYDEIPDEYITPPDEEPETAQNVRITVIDENNNDLSSMEYCIGLNVIDLSDGSFVYEQNTNNNAMIIELKANQEYLININSIDGPKSFNLPVTSTFTADAGTGEVQDIRIAVSEVTLDISQYDNYNYSLGEAYSVDDESITIQAGEVIAFKGYNNASCSSSLNVNEMIRYISGTIIGLIGGGGNEYDFGLISTLKDKFAILNPQTSTFETLDNYVMMYRYNSNDLTLSSCPVDPTNRMSDGNLYLLALETFSQVYYSPDNKEFFRENPILYKAVSTSKNQEETYTLGINIIDENTGEHFNSDYSLEVYVRDENNDVVASPTGQSPMDIELPAGNYTITLENVFVAGSQDCAPYECPVTESVTLDADKAVTIQPTYVASEPDWNLTVNIVDSDTNETLDDANYKANFRLYETSAVDNLIEETGLNYWTTYTFSGLPESGIYKVVLTELVCENENVQKYEIINDGTISNINLSENTTINIQVNKVESTEEPETTVSTARYILTDNEIPMRTMVPAGTIIGIKNLNNGAQIYEEGLYEALNSMEYPIVGCTGQALNTSALLQKQNIEPMEDRNDLYFGCCTNNNSFEVYNHELNTFVQAESCTFFVVSSDENALVMPSERHAYSSYVYNNVNGDIFFKVVEPFEPSYHAESSSQSIYNYFKVYYAEENPNYGTIPEDAKVKLNLRDAETLAPIDSTSLYLDINEDMGDFIGRYQVENSTYYDFPADIFNEGVTYTVQAKCLGVDENKLEIVCGDKSYYQHYVQRFTVSSSSLDISVLLSPVYKNVVGISLSELALTDENVIVAKDLNSDSYFATFYINNSTELSRTVTLTDTTTGTQVYSSTLGMFEGIQAFVSDIDITHTYSLTDELK